MSDAGIDVYIPDPSHGEGKESEAFRRSLEAEFGTHFRFISIGRGGAIAAFVAALIAFVESPAGVAFGGVLTLFFSGERIEKNLDAWRRLYDRLKPTFHREPTFDREGAAVLVANEIAIKLGEEPRSIQCCGFEILERFALDNPLELPPPKRLSSIDGPADKVTAGSAYYFEVEANGRLFLARVEQEKVYLIEIDNTR